MVTLAFGNMAPWRSAIQTCGAPLPTPSTQTFSHRTLLSGWYSACHVRGGWLSCGGVDSVAEAARLTTPPRFANSGWHRPTQGRSLPTSDRWSGRGLLFEDIHHVSGHPSNLPGQTGGAPCSASGTGEGSWSSTYLPHGSGLPPRVLTSFSRLVLSRGPISTSALWLVLQYVIYHSEKPWPLIEGISNSLRLAKTRSWSGATVLLTVAPKN
ncbi:hypothetical protein VNO77_08814 [Canavalia gladiata]|uniref:Uncharacterized protein n=1 Tax=Canavalia gladiata TaxID=3824 RepID=A0AAN9M8R7_CANGL